MQTSQLRILNFRLQIVPLTRSDGFPLISDTLHALCLVPDHHGRNTGKGRLTQASKEKGRRALRGFFGGQITERGGSASHCFDKPDLANKHHLQGWDTARGTGTGLNITSFMATALLGPVPNGARWCKIPAPALPPEKRSACPLLKCRSCLLLNDGATRLEMISFLDQGIIGVPS